tara:strand:+ start:26050 stop:26301 length:252 start_codon:yes stop_codon:yes gene_type:complete
MDHEQKDNSGALFINDKREKESHPNLKGKVVIKGEEFWISGWNNTSKSGIKYIGLSFQEVEVKKTPITDQQSGDIDFLNEIGG